MLADAARRARLSGLVPGFLAASLLKARRKSTSGWSIGRQGRCCCYGMVRRQQGCDGTRPKAGEALPSAAGKQLFNRMDGVGCASGI